MTCEHYSSGVIICRSDSTEYRAVLRCPRCKCRRRFLRQFGGWYGDNLTCTGCGQSWQDGYPLPRSRSPRKIDATIADAKRRWMGARSAADYRAAVDQFMDTYLADREAR